MIENQDYELIRKFNAGDESSFNLLIRKYQDKIYWHSRRMLNDHMDADEVTQEILMVLYTKLNTFKFESALSTWIYKITSNRVINYIRRKQLRNIFKFEDLEYDITSSEDIASDLENREKLEILDKVLKKIPTKQREVFIFRNMDELTYEEISQITNKSIGALKANYFHAQKKILELMKNEK